MTTRPQQNRGVARQAGLPVIVGPIVLAACWVTLGFVANAQHAACWNGFTLANIAGPLALDYRFYANVSPALPLLVYAAQAVSAYVLLFAFGLIALRRRTNTIFIAIVVFGTLVVSAFYCIGYFATYADLANGGFLCDLGFELIPYAAFGLTVLSIALGWLIGWLIDRRSGIVSGR